MGKSKYKFKRHKYGNIEIKKKFLIVTEGTETEPKYFGAFKTYRSIDIKTVGTGRNTIQVVQKAIDLKKRASKNDINVAVSNECFELWFLLHFGLVTTSMNRKDFLNKLDDHFSSSFNCKYSKMMDNTCQLLGTKVPSL